jgi:hypothetical protein
MGRRVWLAGRPFIPRLEPVPQQADDEKPHRQRAIPNRKCGRQQHSQRIELDIQTLTERGDIPIDAGEIPIEVIRQDSQCVADGWNPRQAARWPWAEKEPPGYGQKKSTQESELGSGSDSGPHVGRIRPPNIAGTPPQKHPLIK